jgi:hypothetical protein
MSEFLEANGILVLVLGFVLLSLVVTIAPVVYFIYQWRWVRQSQIDAGLQKAELEAYLKREMLNRGMSASDIKAVLDSGSGTAFGGVLKTMGISESQWRDFRNKCQGFGKLWANCGKQRANLWRHWQS